MIVTLLMVVLVIGLIALASDHLTAQKSLSSVEANRERAQLTAESFIALIERKLYDLASQNTELLKKNLTDDRPGWFDLQGFDQGGNVRPTKALYLDGCALRWRLEPVKLMAATNTADPTKPFFINSERNPDLQYQRRNNPDTGLPHPNLIRDEAQHLYFRVVVESYALKDPHDTRSKPWEQRPQQGWDSRGRHVAMVQAQRVIQFEDVNAFRYLYNYVANGPTGDLEFSPRSSLTISAGGLHSNERILMGGQVSSAVGSAVSPIPVEGVNGIFRLDKAQIFVADLSDDLDLSDPRNVPLDHPVNNLAGTLTLNGVELAEGGDSRALPEPMPGHHDAVRDGSLPGRAAVEDLKTYEEWTNDGYLMANETVGANRQILYFPSDLTCTIHKNNPTHPGETALPFVPPIYATGQPLFDFPKPAPDNTSTFRDIWPVQPGVVAAPAPYTFADLVDDNNTIGTGLPHRPLVMRPWSYPELPPDPIFVPRIARRGVFNRAIGAHSGWHTGLVIRERGRQLGVATANPRLSMTDVQTFTDLEAYTTWMKQNYVVYLGRAAPGGSYDTMDITDEFFAYSLAHTSGVPTTVRELMAHEDIFTNRRDESWFNSNGRTGAVPANVLTINLERILVFFNQPANPLKFPANHRYGDFFNGVIYLERNPRYFKTGITPIAHPLAPDGYTPFGAGALTPNDLPLLGPIPMAPVVGRVDDGPDATARVGTPGTWTVYPSTYGVRIDNSYNAQRRRLTIVTPNTCYLWGDFNPDGTEVPCAVYADTVVALSNSWRDSASADATLPLVSGRNRIRAAIVTYNVPTDRENAACGGSGGALNLLRFLENWNGQRFEFVGSVVVLGRSRFTRSPLRGKDGTEFCVEPVFDLTYNAELLNSSLQPAISIKTTRSKRVLSTVMQGKD